MNAADFASIVGTFDGAVGTFFRVLALGWFSGFVGLALAAARSR